MKPLGTYSEYLDRNLSFSELRTERKIQLNRISELRGGNDVLVYAGDLNKGRAPNTLDYSDLLPLMD